MPLEDDLNYCVDLLKEADPDRFATAMLAPMEARRRLVALYAFNLEVAKTRETVREPMLGEIRLQWWRDVIAECVEGRARRHQVVQPLEAAIREANLPAPLFLEIIDGRSQDFDTLPPADEEALSAYVNATGGALGELAARCVQTDLDTAGIEAARSAGRAWAWIGLARGMHAHLRLGRRVIPSKTLSEYQDLERDIEAARPTDAVRAWAQNLSKLAEKEAKKARGIPTPVLAQAILAKAYLRNLRASGYDPFLPNVAALSPLARSLALIRASLFRGLFA